MKTVRKPKAIHLFLHGRPQKIDPIYISKREIKLVRDWLNRWVKYKESVETKKGKVRKK